MYKSTKKRRDGGKRIIFADILSTGKAIILLHCPDRQAYERGVKIIGATSHYVTRELDAGPIIEQDVVRISHKDTPESLVLKGRDLEKIVLSRAVTRHIERKILTYKNRTIVFG